MSDLWQQTPASLNLLPDHIDIWLCHLKHLSNNVDEYMSINFDYIITVCDLANENCPFIPSMKAIRIRQTSLILQNLIYQKKKVKINLFWQ